MRLILIVLLAIVLLVNCGGDGEKEGDGGGAGWMKAKIDGKWWQSNALATCSIVEYDVIMISGIRKDIAHGETTCSHIDFTFDYHNIEPPETIRYIYKDPKGTEHSASYFECTNDTACCYKSPSENSGKLIITKWEGIGGRANGTFEFIGENMYQDSVSVTNGSFEVPIFTAQP